MSLQVLHTFGGTAFQREGRASARPQGGDELEVFKGQQSHCSCNGVMEWYCRRWAQGGRRNVPGRQVIGETLDFVVRWKPWRILSKSPFLKEHGWARLVLLSD